MKNIKRLLLSILIIVNASAYSFSQDVFLNIGPAFPIADFGSVDINNDYSGAAQVGVNMNFNYIHHLSENGIGIFAGIDINYNGLKQEVKDDFQKDLEENGIIDPQIKYYKYVNIPISAGLNYTKELSEYFTVFTNLGLALNSLKITDMVLEINNIELLTNYFVSQNLGFKVGVGIVLNNKISFAVNYLGLGIHKVEGVMKARSYSKEIDERQKVDILALTLGIQL